MIRRTATAFALASFLACGGADVDERITSGWDFDTMSSAQGTLRISRPWQYAQDGRYRATTFLSRYADHPCYGAPVERYGLGFAVNREGPIVTLEPGAVYFVDAAGNATAIGRTVGEPLSDGRLRRMLDAAGVPAIAPGDDLPVDAIEGACRAFRDAGGVYPRPPLGGAEPHGADGA